MKIRHLILENVRSIKKLDLDFTDPMTGKPLSMVVLAGANGSGKTTMLEAIFSLIRALEESSTIYPLVSLFPDDAKAKLVLDLLEAVEGVHTLSLMLPEYVTEQGFIPEAPSARSVRISRRTGQAIAGDNNWEQFINQPINKYRSMIEDAKMGKVDPHDGVLFMPHYRRVLEAQPRGIVPQRDSFVWAFEYQNTGEWGGSVEAYLVWLNYLDLEDRDAGKPANRFHQTVQIINEMLLDKQIARVKDGRVQVETIDGATHNLDLLSSGEKQLTLLLLEIARHMNPGRIIMIDEPEVSLHPRWQAGLVSVLRSLAEQYDGQVILATHSLEIVNSVFPEEVKILSPLDVPFGPETLEHEVVS